MIFWTEASEQIGMGHLMECLAIADLFQRQRSGIYFIINPYPPAEELLSYKNIPYGVLPIAQPEKICRRIKRCLEGNRVVVNHRNVSFSGLKILKEERFKVIVIDQLGNKTITCDLLINRSIVPEWLRYSFVGRRPKCCFGTRFSVLRNEFIVLRRKKRFFTKDKKTVLVSMGGVDRTGATFRIMQALMLLKGPVNKEIILGMGFAHIERFRKIYKNIKEPYFNFVHAADNLAERMQKADVVISAGGNTLYEMACLGVPGVVLWEDAHEDIQGRAFEKAGTVIHLGNGLTAPISKIRDSVASLLGDVDRRAQMSRCGKKLVDGKGINRIFKTIAESA